MGLDNSDKKVHYLTFERKMATEKMAFKFDKKPREELVNTAVKFLNNPDIQKKPASAKQEFLKGKGLTTEEIKLAFDRSSAQYENTTSHTVVQVPVHPYQPQLQLTLFQRIKDIVSTIASFGAVIIAAFYFYQKFIAPYLFGKPKRKPVDESIQELKDTVTDSLKTVREDISIVQNDILRIYNRQQNELRVEKLVDDVKTELTTVKGLLLNRSFNFASRHQFPTVNLATSSIPAWQLTSAKDKDEEIEQASGSSEADIVHNTNSNGGSQGSDSSLEMIKEVDS